MDGDEPLVGGVSDRLDHFDVASDRLSECSCDLVGETFPETTMRPLSVSSCVILALRNPHRKKVHSFERNRLNFFMSEVGHQSDEARHTFRGETMWILPAPRLRDRPLLAAGER